MGETTGEPRALPETLHVGALEVRVTRSCARRDLYDMRAGRALPRELRAELSARGTASGGDALWIVDVPGVHRITAAAATGRIVVLPRMEPERPAQRAAALELARWITDRLAQL